jgi:hypothetical protein
LIPGELAAVETELIGVADESVKQLLDEQDEMIGVEDHLRNSLSTLSISINHIDVIHLEPSRYNIDSRTLVQTTSIG